MSPQDPKGLLVEGATERRGWRIDWWFVAFTLIGAGLRFATIDTHGLWLDEALTWRQVTDSVSGIIATTVGGVHPPFFHILMHYWVSLVGVGEVSLRSFALVFGVAAIPAGYWAGLRLFDRRVARITAGLLAFWPYHIWYSQEARMYSMLMFFGLLSVGLLHVAIEKNTFGRWSAFWLVTTMGAFVHYFFFFLMIGEVCYYLIYEVILPLKAKARRGDVAATWRRPWRIFADIPTLAPWLIAHTFLVAALGAWVVYAVVLPQGGDSALIGSVSTRGLGYGQTGPSFAPRFNDIGMMVVESLAGFHPGPVMSSFVAMWPLAIYALLMLLELMGPMRRQARLLLWSVSGIPMVWVLGQWQGQVLASRYFMALLAPAVLLAAAVLARMPRKPRRLALVLGLFLALAAYTDQSVNPNNAMRYDNREAIAYVAASFEPGNVIVYEPFYTNALYQYYLPEGLPSYGFPQHGHFGAVRDAKVEIGEDLARITEGSNRVWLILSFQNIAKLRGDAYNTEMWMLRNGFRLGEITQMNHVRVIRYDYVGKRSTFVDAVEAARPSDATGTVAVPSRADTTGGVHP